MKYSAILLILSIFFAGCITKGVVNKRAKAVETLTGKERDPMYNCTPVALAKAEAYSNFARYSSSVGNSIDAQEYIALAEKYARRAYKNSRDKACLSDTDLDTIPDIMDNCPKTPGVKENHGCPISDRDNDGIPDKDDACPDKPGPVINHGCPIIDTDGDGIPDNKDKCPKVPGPPINHGCPYKDTDKDGIQDSKDKCPTKPGPIENNGCPYKLIKITDNMIVLKQKIFFAFNKAKVAHRSYAILTEIAQAMKDHPKWKIEIQGHTDDRGSARYNQKLSEKRAFAVYKFLMSKGIHKNRMNYVGYGEEKPIEDNSTKEGRSVNRRVEFHIVK